MHFMRKYVHIARDIKPALTREASELLADEYSKLRNQDISADNVHKVLSSLWVRIKMVPSDWKSSSAL